MIKLYPHQQEELNATKGKNRVAYYHDMGLGKTFTGAEKLMQLKARVNLVVCQKSKIDDWVQHFEKNYNEHPYCVEIFDLTNTKELKRFINLCEQYADDDLNPCQFIGVINYELIFRRKELSRLRDFTLMLDESSLIQNETAKRAKFILNKLQPENVILLSGTPTNGKYENLWSQLHLLGWNISKELYWKQYIDVAYIDGEQGFPIKVVTGYKNVERLKQKMRDYGCRFLKTEEVFDLPEQIFNNVQIETPKLYDKFIRTGIVTVGEEELVGDTVLTKSLYARMLCGAYSEAKLEALKDLLQSTENRVVIFYNFNKELYKIEDLCIELDKPFSIVNGETKDRQCFDEYENGVIAVQYQAGAMGLNLQKSNMMIFYTLPYGKGSCGLWEQAKKRIHRIGQNNTCFYYTLLCKNTIEVTNLAALCEGKELTDELFREVRR